MSLKLEEEWPGESKICRDNARYVNKRIEPVINSNQFAAALHMDPRHVNESGSNDGVVEDILRTHSKLLQEGLVASKDSPSQDVSSQSSKVSRTEDDDIPSLEEWKLKSYGDKWEPFRERLIKLKERDHNDILVHWEEVSKWDPEMATVAKVILAFFIGAETTDRINIQLSFNVSGSTRRLNDDYVMINLDRDSYRIENNVGSKYKLVVTKAAEKD